MLTILDLVVLAVLALAAVGGWRRGLSEPGLRLVGLLAGAVLGTWLARSFVPDAAAGATRLAIELAFVVGGAVVGAALGGAVGSGLRGVVTALGLGVLDRLGGAVLRAGIVLLVLWFAAGLVGLTGPGRLHSAVLGAVTQRLPSSGTVVGDAVGDVTGALRLPDDLRGLLPSSGVGPPSQQVVSATSEAAATSVLKVEGTGCGTGVEGSAFSVAGTGLVVTNAHVVVGTRASTVADADGTHRAVVVLVDRDADLAVLRVSETLAGPGLTLASGSADNGTPAVVLGYPGDGPLTAGAATIVQRIPVLQHSVGGTSLVTREQYRLDGVVRAGNSGGPLLSTDGTVLGVVNARSTVDDDTGYALTLTALRADLVTAAATTTAADTGGCTTAGELS